MTLFDIAILAVAFIAVVSGFQSGLLRGLATILAYVIAAPVTVVAAPMVAAWLARQNLLPPDSAPAVVPWIPIAVLLIVGAVLGVLMRGAVGGVSSGHMMLMDRLLGAMLGFVRVGLIAVLLVLVFERIMPQDRQPAWFAQSQLRPYLAAAAAAGVRVLPPGAGGYIDRLKRQYGL